MVNIVIPMAGLGSRFSATGYQKPKPFIDVDGKPMIIRIIENLQYPDANYILIARKEHIMSEKHLVKEIEETYGARILTIGKVTEGTACTVLFAREQINCNTPLLIANSDQIVEPGIKGFIDDCSGRKLDGSIMCFKDEERNPKWSFARINNEGMVLEVREKVPISDLATVGIYYFSKGKDFVDNAVDMIINNDRVNNEFYTCPVYNYLIGKGRKIGVFLIDQLQMHGLGTPEDLEKYLSFISANENTR